MTWIVGQHAIAQALEANTIIDTLYLTRQAQVKAGNRRLIQQAKRQRIRVQVVSPDDLQQLARQPAPQGLVAHSKGLRFLDVSDIINKPTQPQLMMAVDHIEDPYNLGAILRSCESFGIQTIIFPKDRNVQLTAGVMKAASGAAFHMDLVRVVNLADALKRLKQAGFWLIGGSMARGASLPEADIPFPAVVVVGNEHKGISKRIAKMVDMFVHIPTRGKTESLNVSVAAGILAYALNQKIG